MQTTLDPQILKEIEKQTSEPVNLRRKGKISSLFSCGPSLFSFGRKPAKASVAFHSLQTPGATVAHSLLNGFADQKPAVAVSSLQSSVEPKIDVSITTWFLPKQLAWINDLSPMRLWEKSRQVGATTTDAFDSVMKAKRAADNKCRP
jgi:hypothetical protein